MELTVGKIAALLIAIGYVIAAIVFAPQGVIIASLALIFIVPLILFPETLGDRLILGQQNGPRASSPSFLVTFMGWVFLLGLPAIMLFILRK